MTFTHEIGHIIGGTCCGGSLKSADLLPWHLPYSIFEPDPFPLVTLWAGLIFGVLAPVAVAIIVQWEWMWFIANFCVLANGAYIATAWFSGDRYLDTPKMLEHGASPIMIAVYCLRTHRIRLRWFSPVLRLCTNRDYKTQYWKSANRGRTKRCTQVAGRPRI